MGMGLAYLITAGVATAVTIGPYLWTRKRYGHSTLNANLGKGQLYFNKAHVSHPIVELYPIEKGAHMRIMNGRRPFLGSTIIESPEWVKFLDDLLTKKDVSVTMYGPRDLTLLKEVEHLRNFGLEYVVTDPQNKELLIAVDKPCQLWIAGYNDGSRVYNSIYTDKPYDRIWEKTLKCFEDLEKNGERQVLERKSLVVVRKPIQ